MTELEAVNEMLLSIGQAPVSTLSVSGIRDVEIAQAELAKVVRYVQMFGFAFNTDEDYVLSPDINGVIYIPSGVLKIDPMDPEQDLVERRHPSGSKAFWDKANLTWEMSEPVKCRIVWGYTFDDLPETLRTYATLSAARKFQKRVIGSSELDGFNAEDEARAWLLCLRDERAVRDTNMFRKSKSLRRVYARRRGASE
jgi:hypothetical protein